MTIAGDNSDAAVTAQLFCRASTSTAAAVDRYHDDLDRLRSMGVLDDVEVTTWPSRVELRSSPDEAAAAAYEEFSEWADDEGVALEPAFNVRDYESEFTGENGTALVTPVACLAVYRDGDLAAVYPHVEGGTVLTVEDGIERLETTGPRPAGPAVAGEPAE